MSDTLSVMRLWALALVAAACGDNIELRVNVEHPSGVQVAHTTISIYESATLTCVDVAFTRIAPDELQGLLVTEETINADGTTDGALTGISRTDHKVIVARGYSDMGAWITAGCAEQDVLDKTVTVKITTEPTVNSATVLDIDLHDPFLAVIAATDPSGKAVSGRRVGWSVYGPAGSLALSPYNVSPVSDGVWEPVMPSCTASDGAAELHPPPPGVIGGYAVQLRAEWAIEQPALYSRMLATFANKPIQPPNGSKKYCAIRINGATRRLVCLDNGVARDFEVTLANGVANLVQRDMMVLGTEALDVVSVPSGSDRDVYMMSTRGALLPLFGAPPPDNSAAPCADGSCQVDDVIAVPPCGTAPGKLLVRLKATGAGQVKMMNARGGGTVDFPPTTSVALGVQVQLDNAGCVTRVDPSGGAPTLRQVMTFHVGSKNALGEFVAVSTRAAYNCSATDCMGNELFPGAGVAFVTGAENRMLVTLVDATGVVVALMVMAPDKPGKDLFVERSRSPAAAVPDRMVVGEYDSDSQTDFFWNISARRGTTFEVSYAREVAQQRLEAVSGIQPVSVTGLESADLTGEGHDDLMIIGDLSATVSGVIVVPMSVTAPTVAVPTDTTCAQ